MGSVALWNEGKNYGIVGSMEGWNEGSKGIVKEGMKEIWKYGVKKMRNEARIEIVREVMKGLWNYKGYRSMEGRE